MKKKYIVVGGVAGGATAAARLRRLDEKADIMLIERGRHVSFANCGLPYYAGGVIKEQDSLLVQTPERLRAMFALDVRTESEVTAVAPDRHEITVRAKDGKTVTEHYDKLLLAPGAHPLVPPIPGIQHEAIHTIRTVEDAEAVKQAAVRLGKGAQAVVVGGGFIGVEMAENLVERGLSVHLAEAAPQILLQFFQSQGLLPSGFPASHLESISSESYAIFRFQDHMHHYDTCPAPFLMPPVYFL